MKTITISQPTYLPWVGYFALIDLADEFVYLDDVQFARRSWQQRNRIKTASGVQMLTVPVAKKGQRDISIADVEMTDPEQTLAAHRRSIEQSYAKARFYSSYADRVFEALTPVSAGLAELNIRLIECLCDLIGISTPRLRSSTINSHGAKADKLVAISTARDADTYVSTVGAQTYLEDSDAFKNAGIELLYMIHTPAPYEQRYGEFVPYLSVIDMLMNVGPESLGVIRSSTKVVTNPETPTI